MGVLNVLRRIGLLRPVGHRLTAVVYVRVEVQNPLLDSLRLWMAQRRMYRLARSCGMVVVDCLGDMDDGSGRDNELMVALGQFELQGGGVDALVVPDLTNLSRNRLGFIAVSDRIRTGNGAIYTAEDLGQRDSKWAIPFLRRNPP